MNTKSRHYLFSYSAVILVAAALIIINLLANHFMTSSRFDLTENKIYTLTPGTKKIIEQIKSPVTIQFYYTKELATKSPAVSLYVNYIVDMLEQYRNVAPDKIKMEVIEPAAQPENETQLLAQGLVPMSMPNSKDKFYFGLVISDAAGQKQIIPYLELRHERFFEYDVSSALYELSHPEKPLLGVISSLPIQGNATGSITEQKPWAIWPRMSDLYQLKILDQSIKKIPDDINILMLVSPKNISDDFLYAIDQFVLRGGHLLAFVDAYQEQSPGGAVAISAEDQEKWNRLFNSWGLELIPQKVLADMSYGQPIEFVFPHTELIVKQPLWLSIPANSINKNDIITGTLFNHLLIATPAVITERNQADANIKISPLIKSNFDADLIDVQKVPDYLHSPQDLLKDYQPGGKSFIVATRVEGTLGSVFNDTPRATAAGKNHLNQSKEPAEIVIVADSDLLYDGYWLGARNIFGQEMLVARASNGNFVLNALDSLSGSNDLISIRAHGIFPRPFIKFSGLVTKAEQEYKPQIGDTVAEAVSDIKLNLWKDYNQLVYAIMAFNILLIPAIIIIVMLIRRRCKKG